MSFDNCLSACDGMDFGIRLRLELGDAARVLDTQRAQQLGFQPGVSLAERIRETVQWHREHHANLGQRYDVFR